MPDIEVISCKYNELCQSRGVLTMLNSRYPIGRLEAGRISRDIMGIKRLKVGGIIRAEK
jgi:hypothetical protein